MPSQHAIHLFEQLFSQGNISFITYRYQPELPIQYATEALAELLAIPSDDLKKPIQLIDWIHPEDRHTYLSMLADYQLIAEMPHFQRPPFRIIDQQQQIKWVREEAYLEFSAEGKIETVAVSWININPEHQAMEDKAETENKLEVMLDSLNLGFFEFFLGTEKVNLSNSWKRLIGYQDYEIKNTYQEWASRVPEVYQKLALKNLDQHLRGESEWYEAVFPMRHKEGHQVWIMAKGKAIAEENGEIKKIIGVHTDLSNMSKLLSELDHAPNKMLPGEDTFQQIFTRSTIGMALFDLEGNLLDINPQMTKFLGYSPDEIKGRPYGSFLHPDERQASIENVQRMIAGEQTVASAVRKAYHKDGHTVYLKMDTFIVDMDNGEKLLCTSGIDVTEEMLKQQELDQLEQNS